MIPETKELPGISNGKGGTQKSIDGKTVIKSPPDPLVLERAKEFIDAKEKIEDCKDRANEAGQNLLVAFQKSKKQRFVRVVTDRRAYNISARELYKLIVKGDKTVN